MDEHTPETVTVLLNRAGDGDQAARERLFRLLEYELRAIAQKQMRGERAGHSLQTTILIDDAFMRLMGEDAAKNWQDRKHFFRTAAQVMRRILVDHERKRRAQRRGGRANQRVAVDPDALGTEKDRLDILALDEALTKLSRFDSRQREVVELRHFAGCTLSETAEILDVSVSTVKADWRMAKAWLHRELTSDGTS